MNLLSVEASATSVRWRGSPEVQLRAPYPGHLVLGVRAEDMHLTSDGNGHFSAEVFTFELLGDSTMVNLKLGDTVFSVKATKDLRLNRGERVHIRLPQDRLYWFDASSGERLRG